MRVYSFLGLFWVLLSAPLLTYGAAWASTAQFDTKALEQKLEALQSHAVSSFVHEDLVALYQGIGTLKAHSARYAARSGFYKRVGHIDRAVTEEVKKRALVTTATYTGNLNHLRAEQVAALSDADLQAVKRDIQFAKEGDRYKAKGGFYARVNLLERALAAAQAYRPCFIQASAAPGSASGAVAPIAEDQPFKVSFSTQSMADLPEFSDLIERLLRAKPRKSSYDPKDLKTKSRRIQVFQENMSLVQTTGSFPYTSTISIENFPAPLTQAGLHGPAAITVVNGDTLDVFQSESAAHPGNWCVLDMANRFHPGGGPAVGAPAQEEQICYRSNVIQGLMAARVFADKQGWESLVPEKGYVFLPDVTVFRSAEVLGDVGASYQMTAPSTVSILASAAYNRKTGHRGFGSPDQDTYERDTYEVIQAQLRGFVGHKIDSIVLGALGCGAFNNDNQLIADLYQSALSDREFKGHFKRVVFAVLDRDEKPKGNFCVFKSTLSAEEDAE